VGIHNLANPIENYSADALSSDLPAARSASPTTARLPHLGRRRRDRHEHAREFRERRNDLKTILDEIITDLTSWVDTRGDYANPATMALLNATKAKIDELSMTYGYTYRTTCLENARSTLARNEP